MAGRGREISAAQAAAPSQTTRKQVCKLRVAAVELLTGDAPIGGLDSAVVRVEQDLPADSAAAQDEMRLWRQSKFWHVTDALRHQPPAFMFGVAASLGRTVLVLEVRGGTYGRLAVLYGERDPNGVLRRRPPRGSGLYESIEALYTRPLEWALSMVAVDPRSYSVLRYDPDASHFDPWLFEESMLAGGGALDTPPNDPVEQRLAQFCARWEDEKQQVILGSFITRDKWMDELLEYLDTELRVDAMSVQTPGFEHRFARSAHGSRQLYWTSQTVDADGFVESGDEPPPFEEEPEAPPPPPLLPTPPPPPLLPTPPALPLPMQPEPQPLPSGAAEPLGAQSLEFEAVVIHKKASRKRAVAPKQSPVSNPPAQSNLALASGVRAPSTAKKARNANSPPALPPAPPGAPPSGRVRRAPVHFGRQGELDGAGVYRSKPPRPSSRSATSLEDETAVPDFVTPGAHVWARGWFAGCGEWFKARVVKVRPNFPRVHVCYLQDSAGNGGALCLPPMDAYLCATDLREWVASVE